MSLELTAELRRDHAAILEHLAQANARGLHTESGRAALRSARGALVAHLEREDRALYPTLNAAAKHDPYLDSLLSIFRHQTQEVSREALAFFSRHEAGGDSLALARDFGALQARLLARIRIEEDQLYPHYDRLTAAGTGKR